MEELHDKIKKLRELYKGTYNYAVIDSIEQSLRNAIRSSDICNLDSVKEIIADAKTKITAIDTILSNDETISEIERHALMHEKKVWIFNIERFEGGVNEKIVESINLQVDGMIKRAEEV